MNVSIEALKLKVYLEHLDKTRTLENAIKLLRELEVLKNENLQFIQDLFLTRLLIMLDSADGLKKNEVKTVLIKCMNIILLRSKITKELAYKTILLIVLKQIYDRSKNFYQIELPEELKMAIFDCLKLSSCHLDSDVISAFMIKDNKCLIGESLFVCKEAIERETYMKIRKKAIEALMSISQCHDDADLSDIVLREQISKNLFVMLPKISSVLVKVCHQQDSLRGPHLIQIAVKALGRFLTLIMQDYQKKCHAKITNEDFLNLVKQKSKSQAIEKSKIIDVEMTDEWMKMASENLAKMLIRMENLRGSEYSEIRYELAIFSFNLLHKCLPNLHLYSRFLLENLIVFSDDANHEIQAYSENKLTELSQIIPNMSQEISELFTHHLSVMPRVIMVSLESEQIASMTMLNSYMKLFANESLQLDGVLNNQVVLEKFVNIMICCCELDAPKELIFFESNSKGLSDEFYQMKMPWKKFKNLKNDWVIKKFSEVCANFGKLKSSIVCIDYILDHIDSLEYLVFLIEILSTHQLDTIMEEFLNETYWSLPIHTNQIVENKSHRNEEWYKDSTPGLYESAIEVRMHDAPNDDEDQKLNIESIKYNILCTCIIMELIGKIALKMKKNFQRYILRILHRVLEKAGNSNFLIKSAGLYSLNCISEGMEFKDLSELIDKNSDMLLFNVQKYLKYNHDNEAILDMMSVIFKYSQTSITAYVEDIVEIATSKIINGDKTDNFHYYLKLFELYVSSVKSQIEIQFNNDEVNINIDCQCDDFIEQCFNELTEDIQQENDMQDEEEGAPMNEDVVEEEEEQKVEEKLPAHIDLIIKILKSSLPFFASSDPKIIILTHEIFENALPILHLHEKEFLPMIHEMWYPFTKQYQGKNFLIFQYSFNLLLAIAKYAGEFVYKRTTDNIVPVINEFLKSSHRTTNKCENLSYTQVFKLQRDVLQNYGQLSIDLGIDEKRLDEIVDLLILYNRNHSNEKLRNASKHSIDILLADDPMLINFKLKFQ